MSEVVAPFFEFDSGQPGGLHVLLIGISAYPDADGRPWNFGLRTVDGPALGAWRLCQLLMNPPDGAEWIRPVRTIRLLLSPSEKDLDADPELQAVVTSGAIPRPTFDNVKSACEEWRKNCDLGDDEAAFFFYGGHGLRFEDADCLVCADFGIGNTADQTSLERCVRFDSLLNQGMIGPRFNQGFARNQFWFVDACRVETANARPNPLGPPRDGLTPRLDDGQDMERPGLWSTNGARFARAAGPDGLTPFVSALLAALRGAVLEQVGWPAENATSDIWPVTGNSVRQAIKTLMLRDPNASGQVPKPMGQGGDVPLLRFASDKPPTLQARITVRPPCLPDTICNFSLRRVDGPPPPPIQLAGIPPSPFSTPLFAGTYVVEWTVSGSPPKRRGWFAALGRDELGL